MTMGNFLLWTWVVGRRPLALAPIQRAVEWPRDAVRTRMIAPQSAAGERQANDGSRPWIHVQIGAGASCDESVSAIRGGRHSDPAVRLVPGPRRGWVMRKWQESLIGVGLGAVLGPAILWMS